MDDLLVRCADFFDATIAQLECDSIEGLNFGLSLDLVERIAMGRVTNAETIDGKCTVTCCKRSIDIAVVVVVIVQIPVPATWSASS